MMQNKPFNIISKSMRQELYYHPHFADVEKGASHWSKVTMLVSWWVVD
jgi:hypothetical protein